MAGDDYPKQITVSRDALRADLAEMELRLRTYLDAKLELKANAVELGHLRERVDRIEGGVLTPALEMKGYNMIDSRIMSSDNSKSAFRRNWLAWAVGLVAVSSGIMSTLAVLHGW